MNTIEIQGYRDNRHIVNGPFWSLIDAVRIQSGTRQLLQVLDAAFARDRELVELLRDSLRFAPVLQHKHILVPQFFEETPECAFLVYDFYDSQSLQAVLDTSGPVAEGRAASIIKQVAESLQFAQIRGIRHGWLTPQAVLLSNLDDEVKLFGFGADMMLAYLYDKRPELASAVNVYIPPENLAHAVQPAPQDIYALGVLFYQLLLGRLPFSKEKIVDLKQEKLSFIIPPDKVNPALSRSISEMVLSLLEPKPQKRAGYNSILNILNPQEDNIIHLDRPPYEKETGISRVRGFFSHVNPVSKNLVGSKKRIAYTILTSFFFFVLLLSVVLLTHLSSSDERRIRSVYDEFVAEQRYKNSYETAAGENSRVYVQEDSLSNIDAEKTERISTGADTILVEREFGRSKAQNRVVEQESKKKEQAPIPASATFTFERTAFADKVRLNNEKVARNLPCTIELPIGVVGVTFIDSRSDFSWSTSIELGENNSRIIVTPDQVGTGNITIALNNASRFGYVFIKVDDDPTEFTTPFRQNLPAGWHRFRFFRQGYELSPADTLVFIRPNSQINVRCTVL